MTLYEGHDEITEEHCTVLLERLKRVMTDLGAAAYIEEALTDYDLTTMAEDLSEMFTPEAFTRLFNTELGKGVILGAYVEEIIFEDDSEVGSDGNYLN